MGYLIVVLSLITLFTSIVYRPSWWYQVYRYIQIFSNLISYYTIYQEPDLHTIRRSRGELRKIPDHIAFIFKETYYRTKSIADLLNWCYQLNIQTVTLYSEDGVEEKVKDEVQRDLSNVLSGQITRVRNKIVIQQLDNRVNSRTSTADVRDRKSEIMFIDRMNGKPAITKVAACYLVNQKRELSTGEFHKDVLMESEFNPPELAVIFGPAFSTSGYPPWHLQFTEMYHFQTHRYIHWRAMLDVFASFAKTKQNYGK